MAKPDKARDINRRAAYGKYARGTLNKSASGMKRKAHGAQKPRHIMKIGEVSSTAQRRDSPAQIINSVFPKQDLGSATLYGDAILVLRST